MTHSARQAAFRFMTILSAGAAISFAAGCSDEDPCQDYINYVCDCGSAECDSAKNAYSDASAKLQDECENILQDYQDADEAAGQECASVAAGDTGA